MVESKPQRYYIVAKTENSILKFVGVTTNVEDLKRKIRNYIADKFDDASAYNAEFPLVEQTTRMLDRYVIEI